LADSGGVRSQSAWRGLCGLWGWSSAATGFPKPILASILLPPLSLLLLLLLLLLLEVAPLNSSCAFNLALCFSLTSSSVYPIGHLLAAL